MRADPMRNYIITDNNDNVAYVKRPTTVRQPFCLVTLKFKTHSQTTASNAPLMVIFIRNKGVGVLIIWDFFLPKYNRQTQVDCKPVFDMVSHTKLR